MKHFVLIIISLFYIGLSSQESIPFQEEVQEIVKRNDSIWDSSKETIVFTGSSSIRFWKDVQQRFPNEQILNAGFGGSQASDLLTHLEDLVIQYDPKRVFIYEGDNDIFLKKRPKEILQITEEIVSRITQEVENSQVVLISAKPSLSRWKLRRKYKRLNKKLEKFATENKGIDFVDIWHPMLNGRRVKADIFVEDGLHMNDKGYDIWYDSLKDFVK